MKFKIIYALAENGDKAESMADMSEEELKEHAKKRGININPSMSKQDIIRALKNKQRETKEA